MATELSLDAEALWRDVEMAIETGRQEERLLPLLVRLARVAPEGSDASIYALHELSSRAVESDAWRAALLTKRIVAARPNDAVGWATLGLAQSLLGHHRYAVRAYRKALRLTPDNPWYAHNLGHLYDAALGRPDLAVPLLARAWTVLRSMERVSGLDMQRAIDEAAASYAHALLHAGDAGSARRVMRRVMQHTTSSTHHELYNEILRCEEEAVRQGSPSTTRRRVLRTAKTEE